MICTQRAGTMSSNMMRLPPRRISTGSNLMLNDCVLTI
nr:MAG TPA: hypothetical protein [Caudoviricetes sp.]